MCAAADDEQSSENHKSYTQSGQCNQAGSRTRIHKHLRVSIWEFNLRSNETELRTAKFGNQIMNIDQQLRHDCLAITWIGLRFRPLCGAVRSASRAIKQFDEFGNPQSIRVIYWRKSKFISPIIIVRKFQRFIDERLDHKCQHWPNNCRRL